MILYLLKFTLCSATLLLFYKLVLEREKLLRFNRFYLLGSLVLSLVLPLISTEILLQEVVLPHPAAAFAFSTSSGPQTYVVQALPESSVLTNFSWIWILGIGYLAVSAWLLFRFGKNLSYLLSRIRNHTSEKYKGVELILLDGPTIPHSFLSFIFVNKADYRAGTIEHEILAHEGTHARQLHSLDILIIEFLKAIFWFNPALYFYRNAIAMNHEFLADASVVDDLQDISSYQHLLIQKSACPIPLPFISKFNYSFIKKRFVMMNKQTSPVRAALAKGSILPLLAVAFFAFSDLTLAQIAPPQPVEVAPAIASQDVVEEYNALVNKYSTKGTNGYVSMAYPSIEDGEKMIELREAMSKEQADTLIFKLYYAKPSPKKVLSKEELEKYKNPNVYGVWVDDKKIANTVLNNYEAGDLIKLFVSRVYPNAQPKTGYKYKYQVDLKTEPKYEAYKKRYLSKPHFLLMRRDQTK